jgi:hypothetical protein
MIMQPPALESTATEACHVGFSARFIKKDQPLGRPLLLDFLPLKPLFHQISAILFAGPQRFF